MLLKKVLEEDDLSYKSRFKKYFESYHSCFEVYRNNVREQAWSYTIGLLQASKGQGNMERIEEQLDLPYHQYQHFLTNSPWSYEALIKRVGEDVNQVMMEASYQKSLKLSSEETYSSKTGLIIDESSHVKKGKKSVGVSRQYAGSVGKVDNCQVGVYASLVNGHHSSLIDERLYVPNCWIEDKARCNKAGIPKLNQVYKTKPVLALEIIKEAISNKISFDWVGGDGLYGHNYELCSGLDELKVLFVLDVHKNQSIYLKKPTIYLPTKNTGRGRPPSRYQTQDKPINTQDYLKTIEDKRVFWKKLKIRKTTKGWLKAWVHCIKVWVWDKKEATARRRILIIRKTIGRNKEITDTKYTLSNGKLEEYTIEAFAFFQAQRYWVERNFDDAKNELGLSDYQVRKWKGWHHHHAIVIMAMVFLLKERVDHQVKYPLMSLADARKMVCVLIVQTIIKPKDPIQEQITRMNIRHRKRKKSIDWYYKDNAH